jgi:hypothetical protein
MLRVHAEALRLETAEAFLHEVLVYTHLPSAIAHILPYSVDSNLKMYGISSSLCPHVLHLKLLVSVQEFALHKVAPDAKTARLMIRMYSRAHKPHHAARYEVTTRLHVHICSAVLIYVLNTIQPAPIALIVLSSMGLLSMTCLRVKSMHATNACLMCVVTNACIPQMYAGDDARAVGLACRPGVPRHGTLRMG